MYISYAYGRWSENELRDDSVVQSQHSRWVTHNCDLSSLEQCLPLATMDLSTLVESSALAARASSHRNLQEETATRWAGFAKQRMGSVGFPYINTVLNIKLGALIRTLSWLHSSLALLLPPSPTPSSLFISSPLFR